MYVAQRLPPGADHVPLARTGLQRPRAPGAANIDGNAVSDRLRAGGAGAARGAGGPAGERLLCRSARHPAPRQPRPVFPHRLVRPEEHRGQGIGGVPASGGRRCRRSLPFGPLRQRLRLGADGLGARAPRRLRPLFAGRERPRGSERGRPTAARRRVALRQRLRGRARRRAVPRQCLCRRACRRTVPRQRLRRRACCRAALRQRLRGRTRRRTALRQRLRGRARRGAVPRQRLRGRARRRAVL